MDDFTAQRRGELVAVAAHPGALARPQGIAANYTKYCRCRAASYKFGHMGKLLTIADLARLIGCPEITVRSWVKKGLIVPTLDRPYRFEPTAALGVILMALARRRGLDHKSANALYRSVIQRTLADFEADVAAGRTHLIVVGGDAMPLCRLEDVYGNKLAFRLAETLGVGFVVIDVAAALKILADALAKMPANTANREIQLDLRPVETACMAAEYSKLGAIKL